MVRFLSDKIRNATSSSGGSSFRRGRGNDAYDHAPTSRYDPTTMSRLGIGIGIDVASPSSSYGYGYTSDPTASDFNLHGLAVAAATGTAVVDDGLSDEYLDRIIDPTSTSMSTSASSSQSSTNYRDDPSDIVMMNGVESSYRRRSRYRPSAGCRRIIRTMLVFGVGLGVVMGVTHLIVGNRSTSNAADGGGGDGGSGTKVRPVPPPSLPPPPTDLASICSTDSITLPGGYQKCEALCSRAECCFLPQGHWFSCTGSTGTVSSFESGGVGGAAAEECTEYQEACAVLDGYGSAAGAPSSSAGDDATNMGVQVEIPSAQINLGEICSPDSLATPHGFDECTSTCEVARCCSQPIAMCKVTNPSVCDEYEPCSVLLLDGNSDAAGGTVTSTSKPNPSSHPDAVSSQAQQMCNTAALMDEEGVSNCREYCGPALCCFAPDGNELDVRIIDEDDDAITGIIGCATADNQGWCRQYSTCQAIFTVAQDGYGSDEAASEAVSAACSDLSTEDGLEKCGRMCSPAECCFVNDDHCQQTGFDGIDCHHYDACYGYYDIQSGETAQQVLLPRPPSNLEAVCSGSKFHTAVGRQMCADACSTAKCCVTDIEVCQVVNPQMCLAFEAHCAEVWDTPYQEVTIPAPPKDLEDQCAGVTLNNVMWSSCDDSCLPARCCDEDISVCKVLNPHLCGAYKVHCGVVWGDSYHEVTIPDAPQDLDRKCAGISTSEARRNTCADACHPAECCDEDITSCKTLNPEACEAYEVHCSQVWGDKYQEVTIPTAPAELETLCNAAGYSTQDDPSRSHCADLCYMAKCCDEDIESCKVLNPSACDAYAAPCASVWGD